MSRLESMLLTKQLLNIPGGYTDATQRNKASATRMRTLSVEAGNSARGSA
jgi:hypothetical protein